MKFYIKNISIIVSCIASASLHASQKTSPVYDIQYAALYWDNHQAYLRQLTERKRYYDALLTLVGYKAISKKRSSSSSSNKRQYQPTVTSATTRPPSKLNRALSYVAACRGLVYDHPQSPVRYPYTQIQRIGK